MNKTAKQLIVKKKVQMMKHYTKYWNRRLEAQKLKIDYKNKNFRSNPTHENARLLRNAKNRLKTASPSQGMAKGHRFNTRRGGLA